ncbi:DUF397 domain-containing protein [Streptomyces sp. NPDC006482]|uniref:DUF397 domain-containing protein n=1 Tax=Streptomyces sp. NPDC006482 TaxID=3154306 RepID=UPI00339E22B1
MSLGVVPVRDSKVPAGQAFAVSAAAFTAFVDSIKVRRHGVRVRSPLSRRSTRARGAPAPAG